MTAVDISTKSHSFRYNPSIYLTDSELKEALKKITTAAEMEEYLKTRYKTKKEDRPPSKRRLNRITSTNSRITGRPPLPKPSVVTEPHTIEIEEPPLPKQRQQQQVEPAGDDSAGPSKPTSHPKDPDRTNKEWLDPLAIEILDLYDGKTEQEKLAIAVKEGHESVIRELLSSKAVSISAVNPEGKTPLMLAAISGNMVILKHLLDAGALATVNERCSETGETAIMLAAQQADGADFIKELFACAEDKHVYVNIEARDNLKRTALLHAAINGHYSNVCVLLAHGADVNAPDVGGKTALIHAAVQGSNKIISVLLEKKAVVNHRDVDGRIALMYAAAQGSSENILALFNNTDGRFSRDKKDYSALTHAATKGNLEAVGTLIEQSGDFFEVDKFRGLIRTVNNAIQEAKKKKDYSLASRLALVQEDLKGRQQAITEEEQKRLAEDARRAEEREKEDHRYKQMRINQRKYRERIPKYKGKKLLGGTSGGESIPLTVDTLAVESLPELSKIVEKATVNKETMVPLEVHTLLGAAARLPISTAPPFLPAAGSLFLYNKSATPNFNEDGLEIDIEKESQLIVPTDTYIAMRSGTDHDYSMERCIYYLVDKPELVIVHYLDVAGSGGGVGRKRHCRDDNDSDEDMKQGMRDPKEVSQQSGKGAGKKRRKKGPVDDDKPSGESIPLTVDASELRSLPDLIEIVRKATIDGKLLETAEVNTLLNSAAALPISTAPPSLPAAGSLFLYNKSATPSYKKDGFNFGKESHNKLVIDKEPRIKVYYGTNHELNLQRRSYFFVDSQPELVLVQYLVPTEKSAPKGKPSQKSESEDQIASGSLDEAVKAQPQILKPPSTINKEATSFKITNRLQPNDGEKNVQGYPPNPSFAAPISFSSSLLRSYIAIGVRLQVQGFPSTVITDAVNEACDAYEKSSESAMETSRVTDETVNQVTKDKMGVEFSDLDGTLKEKWEDALDKTELAGVIKEIRSKVVSHLTATFVTPDVVDAFLNTSTEKRASMALALSKLRKVSSIPKEELNTFINKISKAPVWWMEVQFVVIKDAIVDNDIPSARGFIEEALRTEPPTE
jgi:ankyrin repeat protein